MQLTNKSNLGVIEQFTNINKEASVMKHIASTLLLVITIAAPQSFAGHSCEVREVSKAMATVDMVLELLGSGPYNSAVSK